MGNTSVNFDEVSPLIRQYGEYEGAMMYHYATNFATVGNTLTDAQKTAVMKLRLDYYDTFPDYQANSNTYDCTGAWLYASKVEMPVIENTDFLFGAVINAEPGDIDNNGIVDLGDAILGLQVLVGIEPASSISKAADVNEDGMIGLQDAVYILGKVSGLK